MDLNEISKDIRSVLENKRNLIELTFVEETHKYFLRDKSGKIVSNYPSVSKLIKQFYEPFNRLDISLAMAQEDIIAQDLLLKEWDLSADYANNVGSRTHFLLEKDLLKLYGSYKEVRQPIFNCDSEQLKISNNMIDAGHDFIRLMHRRNAVLLDTEMVLGSINLGYVGQPDKVWLIEDKNGDLGFIVTDWKTNKQKNMEIQSYTKPMLEPFNNYMDTALTHYMIQLPLYARLLLDMLSDTKYKNIKYLGSIIVHLKETKKFDEYRITKDFSNIVFNMNPIEKINDVIQYEKQQELLEEERLEKLNNVLNC
jgi:hypothetical protein